MEMNTIKEALGLDETAGYVQVLERIQELRSSAGEAFEPENTSLTLIRKGEHEQVAPAADGGVVVTLLYPIKKANLVYVDLTFRRARLKDIRRASAKADPATQLAEMVSAMTGVPSSLLDEMDTADFALCGQVVAFLGQPPRRTGLSS